MPTNYTEGKKTRRENNLLLQDAAIIIGRNYRCNIVGKKMLAGIRQQVLMVRKNVSEHQAQKTGENQGKPASAITPPFSFL